MINSRMNPKKMLGLLRNKNLEIQAYAEGSENLRKRALDSLSYNVKKKNLYKKHTLEPLEIIKEVEVEVIKEVPYDVEVIKEVKVPYEVEVIKEVIKEVERIVEVEKIVEKPVEVIKEVDVPYEVIKEIEVIKEVPVDVIREVEVIKEVKVEVPYEVIVEKEVLIPVDKLFETIKKLEDKYETQLKLSKLSKKAMEKRYQTALTQAKIAYPKETMVVPTKKYSSWSATYIYILTMFSLTQILWILI